MEDGQDTFKISFFLKSMWNSNVYLLSLTMNSTLNIYQQYELLATDSMKPYWLAEC